MTNLRPTRRLSLAIATLIGFTMSDSPLPAANYDEAKVPRYELPDPLTMQNGTRVKSAKDWVEKRRPEVLELFRKHVYGRSPERPSGLKFKVIQNDTTALGGQASRREVRITFARKEATPEATLLIYLPKDTDGPVPAFLTINFVGNHTVHPRSGESITTAPTNAPGDHAARAGPSKKSSSAATPWPRSTTEILTPTTTTALPTASTAFTPNRSRTSGAASPPGRGA